MEILEVISPTTTQVVQVIQSPQQVVQVTQNPETNVVTILRGPQPVVQVLQNTTPQIYQVVVAGPQGPQGNPGTDGFIVLGISDPVPPGTPSGTVIIRTTS